MSCKRHSSINWRDRHSHSAAIVTLPLAVTVPVLQVCVVLRLRRRLRFFRWELNTKIIPRPTACLLCRPTLSLLHRAFCGLWPIPHPYPSSHPRQSPSLIIDTVPHLPPTSTPTPDTNPPPPTPHPPPPTPPPLSLSPPLSISPPPNSTAPPPPLNPHPNPHLSA